MSSATTGLLQKLLHQLVGRVDGVLAVRAEFANSKSKSDTQPFDLVGGGATDARRLTSHPAWADVSLQSGHDVVSHG
jgi:hypothetical protein